MRHERQDIELLRIISTFLIIWYHSGVKLGHDFALSGLIVFLVISVYLAGLHPANNSLKLLQRAKRLLIPWAIWFVIYGAKNLLAGQSLIPYEHVQYLGIFSGSSVHLWYLPYIFVCLALFEFFRTHLSRSVIAYASPLIAGGVLASSSMWEPASDQIGYPVAQYLHASAAIFLGIFFSHYAELPKLLGRMCIALLIIISALNISNASIGMPYLTGVAAGCILLFSPFRHVNLPDFGSVSRLTFGIYLCHILMLYITKKLIPNSGLLLPILAFFLAAVFVFIIQKFFPKFSKFATGS